MDALEDLARAAGIDIDSLDYKTRTSLVEHDMDMLDALVALRRAKRMTQAEVAAKMNRNKSAISNFEKLDSDPHLSTIRRYAAAIGAVITHTVHDAEIVPQMQWSAVSASQIPGIRASTQRETHSSKDSDKYATAVSKKIRKKVSQ